MLEHKQMQPPDYHRCLEQVLSSPVACRTLLERLSKMTEAEARSEWSPWWGQEPPPHGPEVKQQVPADVQLVTLQATFDAHRKSNMQLWQRLYDVMGTPRMEKSILVLQRQFVMSTFVVAGAGPGLAGAAPVRPVPDMGKGVLDWAG
ncbi:MAG: hypothetical protein WAW17_15785, partial [Rhodococcus sp. (in: high G+C Gram-positive bacteria)]|uniref:hypothetical protein n=1 Tax=Rhodococcus sp. TaxID=1831 RepID=UPI003BB00C30